MKTRRAVKRELQESRASVRPPDGVRIGETRYSTGQVYWEDVDARHACTTIGFEDMVREAYSLQSQEAQDVENSLYVSQACRDLALLLSIPWVNNKSTSPFRDM